VHLESLPVGGLLFAAGLIALALLIRQENRAASPLIPLNLLRQPAIWRSDALAACHGGALVALITFLPVYLQVVRGTSPSETGLLLVPLTIGIGTGSLITGKLVSRTGLTTLFPVIGLAVTTLCLVALALFAGQMSTTMLTGLFLLLGTFMGTVMAVVQVSVQSVAGPQRLGEAAASVQFSRSIGAAFGTALVATLLFAFLTIRNPESARLFGVMVQHAGQAGVALPPVGAAIQADIREAFRAAFLLIALFTTCGFFLALTNPLKRI
jgi:predicted MFS family arabinose efflux permease